MYYPIEVKTPKGIGKLLGKDPETLKLVVRLPIPGEKVPDCWSPRSKRMSTWLFDPREVEIVR